MSGQPEFRDEAIGLGQSAVDAWNHRSGLESHGEMYDWAMRATDAMTRLLSVVRTDAVILARLTAQLDRVSPNQPDSSNANNEGDTR